MFLFNNNAFAKQFECKWTNHRITFNGRGCYLNTRFIILHNKGKNVVVSNCKIVSGEWVSYITGKIITDPKEIQIDHILPDAELQARFIKTKHLRNVNYCKEIYNDFNNLNILSSKENNDKSDWVKKSTRGDLQHKKALPMYLQEYENLITQKQKKFCEKHNLYKCEDFN